MLSVALLVLLNISIGLLVFNIGAIFLDRFCGFWLKLLIINISILNHLVIKIILKNRAILHFVFLALDWATCTMYIMFLWIYCHLILTCIFLKTHINRLSIQVILLSRMLVDWVQIQIQGL